MDDSIFFQPGLGLESLSFLSILLNNSEVLDLLTLLPINKTTLEDDLKITTLSICMYDTDN